MKNKWPITLQYALNGKKVKVEHKPLAMNIGCNHHEFHHNMNNKTK